jgi:hypothetical protein
LFAAPSVVLAFTVAGSSKVEAQDSIIRFLEYTSHSIDDLIMHRAAKKRVGVTNHGRTGCLTVRFFKNCLDASGWPFDICIALEISHFRLNETI